jgi:Tfp pilus assembly protein PilW
MRRPPATRQEGPLGPRAGITLAEVMIGVAILGIIFAIAPKVLSDTYKFFRLSMARAEIQRDARTALDLMNRRLRQAGASTITVSRHSAGQPYYSKVAFTTASGDAMEFYQEGSDLKMTENGSSARVMAKNLRYLAFTFAESDNSYIMSVSVTFEKAIYSGRSKALQMAVEKVRIMNS